MMAAQTTYTIRDLTGLPPAAVQFCPRCGGRYSAYAADYFALAPDTPLRCCGGPVRLVVEKTLLIDAVAVAAGLP